MGTRSVRLDDETERALIRLTRITGLSISEVLKRGVFAYQSKALQQSASKPYDIYRKLDLGSGGYARAPARDAKKAVADIILKDRGTKRGILGDMKPGGVKKNCARRWPGRSTNCDRQR